MKRTMKYVLTVVALIATLVGIGPAVYAKPFTDVNSSSVDWVYVDAINYVTDKGILNGQSTTLFAPSVGANRAMIVTTLYRLSGETGTYTQASQFTDVSSSRYYYNAVGWAVANGIVTGVTATTFEPDTVATWQQFVTFLYRYAGYKGLSQDVTESVTQAGDYSSISNYARTPMAWAVSHGILLRANETSNLYPRENMLRKTLALYLARFRRNMEGLNFNRDIFWFLNDYPYMLSGGTLNSAGKWVNAKKYIGDEDWNALWTLAGTESNTALTRNKLTSDRDTWEGSCYGFALATALDNYGKINIAGNCANNRATMHDIPNPKTTSNPAHKLVWDSHNSCYVSRTESIINMYLLSWYIPSLQTWAVYADTNTNLHRLYDGQKYGGIGLFLFEFYDRNDNLAGHAVNVYGRPIATSYGYKIMVYDNRYVSKNCWIEIHTGSTKWTGTVVTTTSNGSVNREEIIACKYQNSFRVFDTKLDFDGIGNSVSASNANASISAELSNIHTNTVFVDGVETSLEGKTVIRVASFDGFQIENADGQSILFTTDGISGSMHVYGYDFMPKGEGTPCEYAFLVDDSASFSCSGIGESAEIYSFDVVGGEASGSIMTESVAENGWQNVSIGMDGDVTAR